MLILVDNAATSGQVRPLLPGSPGCLVLVTSRGRLPGLTTREGAARVTLDLLPQGEALALLRKVLGRARVDAEPDAAAEIATRCACLPLALRIAADRAADRPNLTLAGLAAQLAASRSRLDVLAADDDSTSTALRSVFSWSYQALASNAARMFRLLGLHPVPDVSVPAAAALAATSHAAAGQLLQALAGVHLLEETSPGRTSSMTCYASMRPNGRPSMTAHGTARTYGAGSSPGTCTPRLARPASSGHPAFTASRLAVRRGTASQRLSPTTSTRWRGATPSTPTWSPRFASPQKPAWTTSPGNSRPRCTATSTCASREPTGSSPTRPGWRAPAGPATSTASTG